jgi:hypothetical protein
MSDTIYDIFARKLYNLPENWQAVSFKALGDPNKTTEIKGWVCDKYKRGPKKGKTNYHNKLSEPKTVYISCQQYDQCVIDYEKETGKCIECFGHPGQQWIGWSKDSGNKFRECPECKGSGCASVVESIK